MNSPEVLKYNIRSALDIKKKNKKQNAVGIDEIVTELLKALDNSGIDNFTQILNEIYDNGEILRALS